MPTYGHSVTIDSAMNDVQLLYDNPLFSVLPLEEQLFISEKLKQYSLTFQQARYLIEQAADLRLWQETPISMLWNDSVSSNLHGKQRNKAIIDNIKTHIDALRSQPTDYKTFSIPPDITPTKDISVIPDSSDITLIGRCPCPISGEITRCCNLTTLDAVQQCAFACSYCSIQSFYHSQEVRVCGDLAKRLDALDMDESVWHIGTGQSSDSLLLGDDWGTLSAIAGFAKAHPEKIIELKTKSMRTDWIDSVKLPRNVFATWSLNARSIIDNEEHLAASLPQRLDAARKTADSGLLVGFHFHPMVYFMGWEQEYGEVVEQVCERFKPHEVALISMGTLTFTKAALRQMRTSGRCTRVTEMPLEEIAGKFSYPEDVKRTLFSYLYHCFPASWKQEDCPFYYLCMESPSLWKPVFGWEYAHNNEFEIAMKHAYFEKINRKTPG